MVWDTAGQEEFDSITKTYYRGNVIPIIIEMANSFLLFAGAQVCVLAFSTIDKESFDALERWKEKVSRVGGCVMWVWFIQVEGECGSIVMVLVQNKIDLIDESAVSAEEVESLTKRLKLRLFRTSVKENFNIDEG